MNEQHIREYLRTADEAAGPPAFGPVRTARIRRRVRRRRVVRVAVPLSAAAVAMIATSVWLIGARGRDPQPEPQQRIVSLEAQVRQLQSQTESTLQLVREVLEQDRQERKLAALEAELASIPDPMREIDEQVDRTAFLLVYQADRLYKELNRRDSAVEAYKEVIQLFPDNQWADVARERLSAIQQRQINKSNRSERQGDIPCEPRSV